MTATTESLSSAQRIPSDTDAEQVVLGAMLMSPTAVAEVQQIITGSDFYHPAHELVFAAIAELDAHGKPTEPQAVAAELIARGEIGRIGGPAALHDLMRACVTPVTATFYATRVRDKAVLRRLAEAGVRIANLASAPDAMADSATAQAMADVTAVAQHTVGESRARVFGDSIDEIIDQLEEPVGDNSGGLTWGWADVDRCLRPARPGQLIVVGARPAVGKSTFVRNVAAHVAMDLRKRVLLHTIEVDREATELALIASAARVPLSRLQDHILDAAEWERIARARERMDGAYLVVDDSPEMTLAGLRASIRRHRPDLVIVDQLQLMMMPGKGQREEKVAETSRGLKIMAGAEQVPIIAVSKVNRGSETGGAMKPPTMANLRESGSIESDADVVLLLHREDAVEAESPRTGEADVIIAKQRHGVTDTVTLAAQLHYSRFVNFHS